VAPRFIFRTEDEPATAKPGTIYRVSDLTWHRDCRSFSGAASPTMSCWNWQAREN
jgi:hypothetical protein